MEVETRPGEQKMHRDASSLTSARANQFIHISGHRNVLSRHQMLVEMAQLYEQAGVMDQLPFYLSACKVRAKVPHLFLLSAQTDHSSAAVLLYEYKVRGIPTGIFISSDFGGERTVLAPRSWRYSIARSCAEFLLRKRALLVLLSISAVGVTASDRVLSAEDLPPAIYATQRRTILRTFELKNSFDSTLATLGHDTRRNFRRHTRRVEADFQPSFVPEALISESEFLTLNRQSAYPTSKTIARWRFRAVRECEGAMLAGLRAADGTWLSILGGRRHAGITDVDWQLNLSLLEKYSLVTATRAHLMQHEIQRGTRFLRFDGGTAHSMHLSFIPEQVDDLLLARPFFTKKILVSLLPRIFPPDNLLTNVLISKSLDWRTSTMKGRGTHCSG